MSFAVATIDLTSSRPLVVDPLVAVKWYRRQRAADRVLGDFQDGRTALVAPN